MILLSLILLSAGSPTIPETTVASPIEQIATAPTLHENIGPFLHSLVDSTLYFGAGTFFGSVAILADIGWGVCQLSPWASTIGNECLVAAKILWIGATHSFAQAFKRFPFFSFVLTSTPSSCSAWNRNKKMLSQIPAATHEDQELLQFLERRWLAKATGCYPFLVNWMCPSFGISLQVHPETTNSYSRLPSDKFSVTYKNRVKAWKHFLPHPEYFPLILTRPSNIGDYFPFCFEIPHDENIQHAVERLARTKPTIDSPIVVDLTSVLPGGTLDRKEWHDVWHSYEESFSTWCNEHKIDLEKIVCIQRVQQQDIGGIRLLPFSGSCKETIAKQSQFILERISRFGLSANRVELDRSLLPSEPAFLQQNFAASIPIECETKEQWISFLNSIDHSWRSNHPQKTLMLKGTLQVLKDLCTILTQEKWEEIMRSPTRSSIAQACFKKIKEQLSLLVQEDEKASFLDTASHIEQVHADLSSLLEVFSPFAHKDFATVFQKHLTSIPQILQPLTSYGIHTSGMTSLAGIFKAVEKSLGRPPRVLYGENIYYECVYAAERIAHAASVQEATEQDWKDVDLLLAQFNPALKRINFQVSEYHVEKIAEVLHRALSERVGRPLSLAIDCTLDFSNSERVGRLLEEFQEEITRGDLNVMCFRSGLKYDLFGMDNYCGAPFFMVHNGDAQWSSFDSLLTDPALQTDRLSLNWFCLAYQHAAPYLESYRKQIFDNTRAVFNKIPKRLLNNTNLDYRIIPVDRDADPSFVDIKIFGPCHGFRGGLLVGVLLTVKCMEAGHPLLYRPSLGFYHPNLAVLFGEECTTVRLTLGLDPAQVDVIAECFKMIDTLNGLRAAPVESYESGLGCIPL